MLGFTVEAPWVPEFRPLASIIFGLHRGPRSSNKGLYLLAGQSKFQKSLP